MVEEHALSDLTVLDVSEGIAAPYCARLLASYGANVIKVERPGEGDSTRGQGPFPGERPDRERSGLYLYLNACKRGITLDFTRPAGRSLLLHLTARADVLIEGYTPGLLDGLGLGYRELSAVNPGLIVTSVTGFGQTGPYAGYNAAEIVTAAMSGQLYIQGDRGREPLKTGGMPFNYAAGIHATLGTMTAVLARPLIGRGQHVDVSAQEVGVHFLQQSTTWYTHLGLVQTRIGSRMPFGHPFTILPCKDGYVAITVLPQWIDTIGLLIEQSDLAADPRFATPLDCIENADALDELMLAWLMRHTRQEIVEAGQALRMAFDYVYTVEEMLADPQYRYRNHFAAVEQPGCGTVALPGAPFRMSETPFVLTPAPQLGQHNAAVYGDELGLTLAEIEQLRREAVI